MVDQFQPGKLAADLGIIPLDLPEAVLGFAEPLLLISKLRAPGLGGPVDLLNIGKD